MAQLVHLLGGQLFIGLDLLKHLSVTRLSLLELTQDLVHLMNDLGVGLRLPLKLLLGLGVVGRIRLAKLWLLVLTL